MVVKWPELPVLEEEEEIDDWEEFARRLCKQTDFFMEQISVLENRPTDTSLD